jgi:hypothetical protein
MILATNLGAEGPRRGMAASPLPFQSTPAMAELDPWVPSPPCLRACSWGRWTGAARGGDCGEEEAPPSVLRRGDDRVRRRRRL